MKCPVCDALNREHNRECEAEAIATLRQRLQSLLPRPGETFIEDQIDPIILGSRKRQAYIAFKLNQHQTQDHRDRKNQRAATA